MKELKGTGNTKCPGVLQIIRHMQFLVSVSTFRWPQFKAFGSSQDHCESLSVPPRLGVALKANSVTEWY